MTQKEFMQLVMSMRKAQKRYFEFRSPSDLEKSKKLERKVDAILKDTFEHKQERLM